MAKNTDPFAIWNNPMYKDDPLAAHNGYDSDNPYKPWNEPYGSENDLTDNEANSYNINRNRNREDY